MLIDIISWILVAVMTWWIISSVVSIVKKIIKKLRVRGLATEDTQNTNNEKECDQSNSSENASEE